MTTPTEALMRIVRENYGCERARCVHPTEESCQCYAAELLLGRVQAEALEEAAGLVDDESPILAPIRTLRLHWDNRAKNPRPNSGR